MHNMLPRFLFVSISLILASQVTAKEFKPTSSETRDTFYNQSGRNIRINVEPKKTKHRINERFLGINLSYFNTTDEIWNTYGFNEKLKNAGVGAMRYPGGEETSYFHWRHPGVNGYEDLWDDPSTHGTSPGRGKFQSTWVAPENWDSNESFMDFDEFMAACKAVGAEPIVGINMSSGLKHKRQEEGVKEALEWMRYAKQMGYAITYWFLDNETWNREANHTFTDAEYIEECLRYGRAIKAEFPNVKLIANPVGCSNLSKKGIQSFVSATGEVIDFIDIHWYWAWGMSTFEHWQKVTPLTTDDKWRKPRTNRTYAEDIALIREACTEAGYPDIGVMALEWNIAPSIESSTFSQALIAVIQAELLIGFADNEVELTCLWPLLWQTSRDVWPEQDNFPSVVTANQPFNKTLSSEMFRMMSPLQGGSVVESISNRNDVVQLAVDCGEYALLYLINKNHKRRKATVKWPANQAKAASGRQISTKLQAPFDTPVELKDGQLSFFAEPNSFTVIRIQK
jgi:alpha-L-arabinofuranosidase